MTRKIELQEMIQEVSQLQQDKEKGENLIFSPVIGAAAQAEIFQECESLHGSGEGDPRANLDRGILMNELAKGAQHVEEKFLRPKGAKIFRVNREMREKNTVYDHIFDEFRAKLMSNHKIRLCQNFKIWSQNPKSIFIPKLKIDLQNRSL